MPFSSLARAGASVVRVPSNTGGLGGVMLHEIETDRPRHTLSLVKTSENQRTATFLIAAMVLGKQSELTCGG